MYKCEFFTRYVFARTASMDYPNSGQAHTTNSPQSAQSVAKAVIAEADAMWQELESKFTKDEIYKTDIRGIRTRETS